ncbi:unnamed protein product [Peronospora belbahrii]|uniref:Uncharacterized protein n=1 Tax=Peronospora belbahrii TaxID=622444 RepID=A0ABN8CQ73_9STRA|nr:unnamed protein product [Peronospora belbahrii]
MSEFSDVAALFGSKHSARILLQHRSSVGSVDGDSEVRSLPEIEVNLYKQHKKEQSSVTHTAEATTTTLDNQSKSMMTAPLSLEEVQQELEKLEKTPVPTTEEINDILAQESNEESESSDSDDSSSSDLLSSDDREIVIMKVLIVGNARCGKTCTIQRFTQDHFNEEYVSTIGADFEEKLIEYDDQLSISLQLWDIAGQDRFAKFTRGYFREAKGAVIVCDITRANTFDAVVNWKKEIDTCCKELNKGAEIPVVMVANKSDLLVDPMDALDLGVNMQKCVEKNNIVEWFRASAKSGEHIDDAFRCLIDRMVEKYRVEKEESKKIKTDVIVKEEKPSAPETIRLSQTPRRHRAVKHHGGGCDCN